MTNTILRRAAWFALVALLPLPLGTASPVPAASLATDSDPPSPPKRVGESLAAALADLKGKLASGERGAFPIGTVQRGRSHFVLVDEPMSWTEAERFALEHGAHLAVLPTEDDRTWVRNQFSSREPYWVGAAKGANDGWQWIDGSAWEGVQPDAGSQLHRSLALSSKGALFSSNDAQRYGFVLQWQNDGTNPATLQAQLERTALSAAAGDPTALVYPLGTRTLGDCHYFLYEASLEWNDARKFANSLGATLAVPSSEKVHKWIATTYSDALDDGEAIWLGGFRLKPGERWQWLSREAWNNAGWSINDWNEEPARNRLAARKTDANEMSWEATEGASEQAVGMLLEWAPAPPPAVLDEADWKSVLAKANRRIASDVESELAAFGKDRDRIVKAYVRAMKTIARSEPDRFILREIDRPLDEAEEAGTLLASLPKTASDTLRAQQETTRRDLDMLINTHSQNMAGHLRFYVDAIRSQTDQLAAQGFLDLAAKMHGLLTPIEDKRFIPALLSATPPKKLPWSFAGE